MSHFVVLFSISLLYFLFHCYIFHFVVIFCSADNGVQFITGPSWSPSLWWRCPGGHSSHNEEKTGMVKVIDITLIVHLNIH